MYFALARYKKKVLPFPEAVPASGRGNPHLPIPPATYKVSISRLQTPTSNTKHSLVACTVASPVMKQFIKAPSPAFAALPLLPGADGDRPAHSRRRRHQQHELQFWRNRAFRARPNKRLDRRSLLHLERFHPFPSLGLTLILISLHQLT